MPANEIYNHYRLALEPYERVIKELRELNRKTGEQDWPDCCYFPFSRWVNLVKKDFENDSESLKELMALWLSSLVAWKQSQIEWSIDGAACNAIHNESYDSLPVTFLLELPKWGVFIDFKEAKNEFCHPLFEKDPIGAFVTLDYINHRSVAKIVFVRKGMGVDEAQYMPYPVFLVLDEKSHIGDSKVGENVPGLQDVMVKLQRALVWHQFNALGKLRGVVS